MDKKKTIINVFSSLVVLVTNVLINFVLSPYIIKNVGVEANGFISLANNIVTYANLVVIALNAMAARFITIEYAQGNYKKANLYYNSVFWGNLGLTILLFFPISFFIIKLNSFVDVPIEILNDVKLLFMFVFLNFFMSTGLPNWDCGTFVTNKVNLSYTAQAISYIIRCIILFLLFVLFRPQVWFVGIAATVMTIVQLSANCFFTHKYTPELRVSLKKPIYSVNAIKELVGSGIWSSISNVGGMLLSGLDLFISNLFLGATAMGILSVSKVLYNLVGQLATALRNAFQAELTIAYAQNDSNKMRKQIVVSMKLISVLTSIPVAGVIVLAGEFYSLWVPSQDSKLLHILTILSLLSYIVTCSVQALYNVFNIVNKVKVNAIAILVSGIISTGLSLILVKYTDYGIYAVAGVSSIINAIRNLTFTTLATTKYLGFKWYEFYPSILSSIAVNIVIIILGNMVKSIYTVTGWFSFLILVIIIAMIGLIINYFIYLNSNERNKLLLIIRKKLKININ